MRENALPVRAGDPPEPQKIDLWFIEMLGENGIPFGIILPQGRQTLENSSV